MGNDHPILPLSPMICSSLDFLSNLVDPRKRIDYTGPGRPARSLSNGNERF